ncbi:MAG: hypothetical protein JOZ29_12375 [Deltaproteobacteria bacterium]|nr:hypothetical protein [Deltaproteobacteria bacterium]
MGKYDLKGVRKQRATTPEPSITEAAPAIAKSQRAPGKRSRPDFIRTTVYMRDDTKLKAVRLLQDLKDERDLSDLIESLVSGWVSEHTNV